MLQNAYLLAKIGADTAENERHLAHLRESVSGIGQLPMFGKTSANFRSFSAVSAPIFARKYAFCSIFQNLPDYLAEIFEIWQNFANYVAKFANFAKFQICQLDNLVDF